MKLTQQFSIAAIDSVGKIAFLLLDVEDETIVAQFFCGYSLVTQEILVAEFRVFDRERFPAGFTLESRLN